MHKRKFLHLVILMVGMIVLFSCEYEKIIIDAPDPTIPVTYSGDIQPIWDKGCAGCHPPGGPLPDLTPANSYNSLMSEGFVDTLVPDQSIIYTRMISGGSMAPYANAQEAGLVLTWIIQGAKNN